ncbi:ArnT family glycosyltransferase [Elusimicrobiota bacterium]
MKKTPDTKKIATFAILIIIVGIGAYLRMTGLWWGLPGKGQYFHGGSLYVDEVRVLKTIKSFNPKKLDFEPPPESYAYSRGAVPIYFSAFCMQIAKMSGWLKTVKDYAFYKKNPRELGKIYLAGRLGSVFVALLTILVVFIVGRRYYGGAPAGLISAFICAITPIHVVNSHYIQSDIYAGLGVALTLWASLIVAQKKDFRMRPYIIAGMAIGLTAQMKYVIFICAIFLVLAHYHALRNAPGTARPTLRRQTALISAGALSSILTFLALNPYFITNIPNVINGLVFMRWAHANQRVMPEFSSLFYATKGMWDSLGIPLYCFFILSMITIIRKRNYFAIMALSFCLLLWLEHATSTIWAYLRYNTATIPAVSLICGCAYWEYEKRRAQSAALQRWAIRVFFWASCLFALGYSFTYSRLMSEQTVQSQASDYIVGNIPSGSRIGLAEMPFFNEPTIAMTQYWYSPEKPENKPLYENMPRYDFINLELSLEKLRKEMPDYLILTDFNFMPRYVSLEKSLDWRQQRFQTPFINEIFSNSSYELMTTLKRDIKAWGINFAPGFPPEDLRYIMPTILIFKKR